MDNSPHEAPVPDLSETASHMQAMEGMLQSCIDRGVIDKPSAEASIKRSRQLRKQLLRFIIAASL